VSEKYRTFVITAGGSSARPVDCFATPDLEGCLPVGVYRFETTIAIETGEGEKRPRARGGSRSYWSDGAVGVVSLRRVRLRFPVLTLRSGDLAPTPFARITPAETH